MSGRISNKIVTDGLVLYLDAANTRSFVSGATAWNDLTPNKSVGVLTNGPTYSSSNYGSIVFDGVNDYVELGSLTNLQFTNTQPFSISIWFKYTESGSVFSGLFTYALAANRGWYLQLDSSGGVILNGVLFEYWDGSNFRSAVTGQNTITKNVWNNVTFTDNGSNTAAGMKMYINSVLSPVTARSDSSPSTINYIGLTSNIGARGGQSVFNGNISNTLVYNKTLTQSEVTQNYNALKNRFGL